MARAFELKVLVETGTFEGNMLSACHSDFKWLYSIELSRELFLKARERFAAYDNIVLIPGDSAVVLTKVLQAVDEPALVWLDAHAMIGVHDGKSDLTPIREELLQILNSGLQRYVILIDDARLFGEVDSYPELDEVRDLILQHHPDWTFEVKHDVIRCYPII